MAACVRCGAEGPPGARFCPACGAPVQAERPLELRKTVTVLFCDVVASTELGGRLDPESLRRLMKRFLAEAEAAVARHGGTLEKFIGDEVLAVFGVPAVREDDALRAVRTAAELRSRLVALGDEVEADLGTRLEVRIGVNTGEVVAGDPASGHGFVTGEAVAVGKRLEQAAAPGEILLGETTHALVAHAVETDAVGPLPLKGREAPVAAHRLVSVRDDAPPLPRRADVPLVGRRVELARLRDALEDAVAGSGGLFTIVGPPGIGKSRLARELVARGGGVRTLVGRCPAYGEGLAGRLLRELLAEAWDDALLALPSHDLYAAVRRALAGLAREGPVLAVVDDLHWAEPTLLDLVQYLGERLADAPALVLCLARPELLERRPDWPVDATLEPLTAAESESLLDELRAPRPLRARIAEAAEGNPLFVEQLAAIAAEAEDDALELPGSIRAVLAERLDRLDREERAVLERAAVVGRDFSLAAVLELSPPELRATAPARLLALARKELVGADPRGSDDDAFRFRHALIRDAAYDGLPKSVRADLHGRLADRLEAAGEDDALVGFHLERAARYRQQLGRPDAATGERAARRLGAAGRRAFRRGDVPAAISLLGRAAALAPQDATLLVDLGSARFRAGEFAPAEETLCAAAEAARALGDRRSELRAALGRQFVRSFTEPERAADENLRVADELIPELEAVGDELGLADAWWLLSESYAYRCRWQARAEALERALAHARRAPDASYEASAITAQLAQALYYGPTPVPEAIARCEELLAEAAQDRPLRAALTSTLAGLHAMRGDAALARRLWADAVAMLEELGLRFRRLARAATGAHVEALAGDPAAAERELRQAYEALAAAGERGVRSTLGGMLADLLCADGRDGDAEALAREVAATAGAVDLAPQVLWRTVLARVLARRGDADAERLAREAEEQTRATDFSELRAGALLALAEAVEAGDPDGAARLRDEARAVWEAKGNVVAAAAVGGALLARRREE